MVISFKNRTKICTKHVALQSESNVREPSLDLRGPTLDVDFKCALAYL